MPKNIKKICLIVCTALFVFSFAFSYHAQLARACTTSDNSTYCLLAPIPGLTSSTDGSIDVTNGFGDYINRIIRIFIGLLAVMAVIMIVFGGIQYMISDVAGEKSAGKDRIMNAIWGLVLALASYMLLNTINPDFVHLGIHIPAGTLTWIDPYPNGEETFSSAATDVDDSSLTTDGITCPGSGGSAEILPILNSYLGHVTYRFGGGHSGTPLNGPFTQDTSGYQCPAGSGTMCNTFCPSGTVCLDCSAFVDSVLKCAGISSPAGGGTGVLFNSGNAAKITSISGTTVNGQPLKDGDLLGWTATDNPGPDHKDTTGHVVIYAGGYFWDSHGGQAGRVAGASVGKIAINNTYYLQRIDRVYHSTP